MLEMAYDDQPTAGAEPEQKTPSPSEEAKVNQVLKTIKADKEYHKKAFEQMSRDMFMAMKGRDKAWGDDNHSANFAGRHVKQKTASLYAKNPKAVAKRAERMDFAVWDETQQSLMMAMEIVQAGVLAQQQAAMAPPEVTEMGNTLPAEIALPTGFQEAMDLVRDYQQGMSYRKMVDKVGKTLEILFARALRDQEPLTFKEAAKQLVRRACTCGVGYVELGFQREYGPRDGLNEQLADARARLDHLRRLSEETAEGEITSDMAEAYELEASVQALTEEPHIVLREGLTFDFPVSTKVIPDKLTKSLTGFVGARHLTIEYLFTVDEIEEMFPEADIRKGYTGYGSDGKTVDGPAQMEIPFDSESGEQDVEDGSSKGLVCVYKHYDKPSGLVYYVADGHKSFLRKPAAPDVFVEKFWPVFALTFNAVESETELYPPSDVYLLSHQQMEHNRARQGMREHRKAARPRWVGHKGLLDEEGLQAFKTAEPFDVVMLNNDGATKIADIIEAIPVPGVDPNLYATEQFEQDRMLSAGMQDAGYGGMAKATATESSISANSTMASDSASSDDLDAFLSQIARSGGQILLKEMSEEQVRKIVGPGAVWPEMSLAQIASEVFLEVEAGSSGRPNQAVEIDNFTKMAPILMQIPGFDPEEFGKEAVRRMDDRLDVNKFIKSGIPSIVSMNQAKQPGTGDPATDPSAQGGEGGANAPQQPQQESPGGEPAFGSNQV